MLESSSVLIIIFTFHPLTLVEHLHTAKKKTSIDKTNSGLFSFLGEFIDRMKSQIIVRKRRLLGLLMNLNLILLFGSSSNSNKQTNLSETCPPTPRDSDLQSNLTVTDTEH